MSAACQQVPQVMRAQRRATPPDVFAQKVRSDEPLLAALRSVESWREVVRILVEDLGLSRTAIARGANTAPITVGRWLDRDSEPRAPGRLDDLRYVVMALLVGGAPPRRLAFWLDARDTTLGVDPLTAIAAGRAEEVIAAGLSALAPPAPGEEVGP